MRIVKPKTAVSLKPLAPIVLQSPQCALLFLVALVDYRFRQRQRLFRVVPEFEYCSLLCGQGAGIGVEQEHSNLR